MIVSYSRLAGINLGIRLVDHNRRIISLFAETPHDFSSWYNAFEEALRAASTSPEVQERSVQNLREHGFKNMSPKEKLAKLKLSHSYDSFSDAPLNWDSLKTGWLCKEYKSFFAKKKERRYFTLSGDDLSYFDVNIEGREAEGSGKVKQVKKSPGDPTGIEVLLSGGKVLKVFAKDNPEEMLSWYDALLRNLTQKS